MIRKRIEYPVKIGFDDMSGRDENYITDKNNLVLVRGWGDCCKIGGIKERNIAVAIINLLNKHQPIIYKIIEK